MGEWGQDCGKESHPFISISTGNTWDLLHLYRTLEGGREGGEREEGREGVREGRSEGGREEWNKRRERDNM